MGECPQKKKQLEADLCWKERVKTSYGVEEEDPLEDGGDAGDAGDGEGDFQGATNEDKAVDTLLNLHQVAYV